MTASTLSPATRNWVAEKRDEGEPSLPAARRRRCGRAMAVVETSAQGKRGVNSEGERKRSGHGLGASRARATVMLRGLKTVTSLRGSSQRDVACDISQLTSRPATSSAPS